MANRWTGATARTASDHSRNQSGFVDNVRGGIRMFAFDPCLSVLGPPVGNRGGSRLSISRCHV